MIFVAIYALGARVAPPVSLQFPQLAYEGGGGLNVVNVTLVDIRAWDTFGEISVLALAATGVASLIFVRGRGDRIRTSATVAEGTVGRRTGARGSTRDDAALAMSRRFAAATRDAWLVAGRTLAPERRSIIFEVVTRLIFHSMIVFSIYLLLAGHNLPGGGFAGGLTAGLALTIRYLAGGRFELREATPVGAGTLLGIGLATAAAVRSAPLLLGGQVFQSAIVELWLPVFGDIKFVTSTIFDIGVYIVVVGLALDVLRSLGAEIDEHFEEQQADGPSEDREDGGSRPDMRRRRNHRQGESMSVNLTLLTVMGALYACGIYLILERSLTRVLLGLMLLANATNLLILATGGYAGLAPIFDKDTPAGDYNDPLPQALILTSIVISFAVTAFMLGIIYRTWVLARQDEIQDDAEDRRVAETPSFDAEDDAVIPVETSEFPLAMPVSARRPPPCEPTRPPPKNSPAP